MFDTERFIIEVQNRVCLWDSREKPDRTAKKRAWEEIAKILYDNWDSEIETKQREIVSKMAKSRLGMLLAMMLLCLSAAVLDGALNRCSKKRYNHKAVQTDQNGRRCWDDVKIMSCGGYCMSYEIADWQFPYKESHHNVCVHEERRPASVRLRHCDPDVEPGTELYHYIEAASCSCQLCSSEDTSCEWLPPDTTRLGDLILREELLEEELD